MSEMALDLIRQAKAEGWKTLDLGNTGIVGEVPAEIWELTELEELILSDEWRELGKGVQWSKNSGPKNEISSFPAPKTLYYDSEDAPKLIDINSTDCAFAAQYGLALLKRLVLVNAQVADIQPFAYLTNLQLLILHNTQVSDLRPIELLGNLHTLVLLGTQVDDLQPISHLISLLCLDLSQTKLVDLRPIALLCNLHTLILNDTEVVDLQPIKALQNLRVLALSKTPVKDLRHISELHNLRDLGLSFTKVVDLQPIAQLTNLCSLVLFGTSVANLQPLAKLNNLETLILYETKVIDLKPISNLTNLQKLDLSLTMVSNLNPLKQLSKLRELSFDNTSIFDIQPISHLENLCILNFSGTNVTELRPIAKLNNLQMLRFNGTLVEDIQPLAPLHDLRLLEFSWTQVANLEPIAQLHNLQTLMLDSTQVVDLHPIRYLITKGIELFIQSCPLTNPPYSIAIDGNEAILAYWREKGRVGKTQQSEIKLFLLGNPTAGKTTMREALITGQFDENIHSTPGAELSRKWYNENFAINIWDFGGQEYFHATYRLLLNDEAVYALMIDPNHNEDGYQPTPVSYDPQAPKEEEDLEHFHHRYWMETIHARAPKSEVLVVWNKLELKDRKPGTFSEADKKGRDAVQFQEFRLGIQAALRDKDKSWLNHWGTFTDALKQQIQTKLKGKEVLSYWPEVRKAVEGQAQYDICISWAEFDTLVRKGDEFRDVELCIIYLRDICGSILYWGDQDDLKDVVFINPNRINRLIYSVLSRGIKQGGGQFDHAWATKQVAKTLLEFDPARSAPTEEVARLTKELIEVMMLFRIIFEIKAKPRQASELPRYIAPQYLPAAPPRALSEEKQWDRISSEPQFWIKFEGYVPRHVFPCLVAEKGPLASHRLYWKTGILFSVAEYEGVKALVEVDYQERVITISSNVVQNCAVKLCGIFHDLLEIIGDGTPISISLDGQTYRPYSRLEKAYQAGLSKVENESGDFEAWGDLKKSMPDGLRPASPAKRKHSEKPPKGKKPAGDPYPAVVKELLEKIAVLMEKVEALSQQNQQTHSQLAEINGLLHSYFTLFLERIADLQNDQGHLRSDLLWMLNRLNRLNDKADLAEGLLQHLIQRQGELDHAIQQGLKALPSAQQQAIEALQPPKASPIWLDAAKAIKLKLSTLTLVAAALAATSPAAPVALPTLLLASAVDVETPLPGVLGGVWKVLRKIAEPFRMDGH